jgi:hypothetical protein
VPPPLRMGHPLWRHLLGGAVRGELYQNVASGGVGVRAGAVGVGDQPFGSGLVESGDMDIEGDGEGEAVVAFGGADGDLGVEW